MISARIAWHRDTMTQNDEPLWFTRTVPRRTPVNTTDQSNAPKLPPGHEPITIYVNTRAHRFERDRISFEEVVALAFPEVPSGENVSYSVLYHRGHGNDEGTVTSGQSVKVKEGMRFDVTPTDRS
jgi:Multiubiquitin